MCHGVDSQLPISAPPGAAAEKMDILLRADDGNEFMAFVARPTEPNGRAVVVMPDVRGLFQFYKDLAVRFAEFGFGAVAFDYFGRTAQDQDRGESFPWEEHIAKTTPEMVAKDVRACVKKLRSTGPVVPIFTVGFCWGGSASWRQSAEGHGLAGSIGFYGFQPMTEAGRWIPNMESPLLMLLAGLDTTPKSEYEEFASKIRARGIMVESHIYEGCSHGFFDRRPFGLTDASTISDPESTLKVYDAACRDSWDRVLNFTERLTRNS